MIGAEAGPGLAAQALEGGAGGVRVAIGERVGAADRGVDPLGVIEREDLGAQRERLLGARLGLGRAALGAQDHALDREQVGDEARLLAPLQRGAGVAEPGPGELGARVGVGADEPELAEDRRREREVAGGQRGVPGGVQRG